jgi:AcrR family transcriptional regulator
MEDIRDRILSAAARVYAESGFRGATTRRVAQEARVNEITLFRHFGTKEALVKAALKAIGHGVPTLPREAQDPQAELTDWALSVYRHWYQNRGLVSQVLGDLAEHPELAPDICEEPGCEHAVLSGYLEHLRERGDAARPFIADAAAGLLLGGIFTHALLRDHFETPELPPVEEVIHQFVGLLLGAIGVESGK